MNTINTWRHRETNSGAKACWQTAKSQSAERSTGADCHQLHVASRETTARFVMKKFPESHTNYFTSTPGKSSDFTCDAAHFIQYWLTLFFFSTLQLDDYQTLHLASSQSIQYISLFKLKSLSCCDPLNWKGTMKREITSSDIRLSESNASILRH